MYAAVHANGSSSLAHIERKHKRSSRGFVSVTIARISLSSRCFGVLPRFSFDKMEIHRTRQQVGTPFHSHIGGHRMCILRTIANRPAYSQFNCINTRGHERFNDRLKIRCKYIKSEEYNIRGNSFLKYNTIQ